MEETQVLNTEQVPTDGNNPKVAAERVKQLHDALVADEVMKDYVPNDFRRFVEVYKDPKNMNSLYDALSADDVFKDYIPDSKERMYDLYVLGKQKSEPTKEPLQSSVLPSPSNGGVEFGLNQTINTQANQPNVMAEPQPLSPLVDQITPDTPVAGTEEIRFAPEKEIEYKTPESQLDEAIKKTSAEMQKSALRTKGSIGGAVFNSLAEGFTGTVEAASRMTMDLMTYMMPELISPDSTPEDINKSFEQMGIKKTLDKQIKSEGTTKEYIEKQKEEGGILTQGALGLAESIYPMMYPKQAGFFFLGFNGAAREIEKTMPELSKDKQLLYAFTQGSVALALENFGFTNLIKNTSVTKAITGKVLEKLKGVTGVLTPSKVQQTVLDVANGFASEFETGATQFVVEEGIKQATDYLGGEKDSFKFEGWESFLTNTLKAGATEGVGGAIMKSASLAPSIMLNPKNKSEAQEANAKNETLMQDLQNPNIPDDVKEVIQKQADENSKIVLEKAFEDKQQVDSLPTEAKTEVEQLNKTINENTAVLQNENVSAETKELVAKANEDLASQIEKIFKDNPQTTENDIQEPSTTQEVSRTGEAGQNIPEGGQGVRPGEQGQETAQQGEEEVISEPTIDQQLQDVKDKNFVTFNYKNESEVPDILKKKISSKGENNGVPFVKVTLPKSLADYYLQTTKTKTDEKTEKGPMLEGLQATGDEGKGGQASAELRTESQAQSEKVKDSSKPSGDYEIAQQVTQEVSNENPDASILLTPKGNDLTLAAVYVAKEKRGKGIGSNVLESVKKQANKLGKKIVLDATNELDEETDLERLGKFYEKNGFVKVSENKFEYDPSKQLTQNIPTNESKNENGKQKDGEKRNENVSENVQGKGKDGGQNVNVQDEGQLQVETNPFTDLANQLGEAAKEAVKPETPTAQTFADISQTGKAGRDARESARKKFGKDAVAKMEEISRNFDKLIEQLESENKVRKECP